MMRRAGYDSAMYTQFAKIALSLIDQVRGPYDDQNMAAVMQTKNFLKQIASGQLIVSAPKQKKAPKL